VFSPRSLRLCVSDYCQNAHRDDRFAMSVQQPIVSDVGLDALRFFHAGSALMKSENAGLTQRRKGRRGMPSCEYSSAPSGPFIRLQLGAGRDR